MLTDTLLAALYQSLVDLSSKGIADMVMLRTAEQVVRKLVDDPPNPVEQILDIMKTCGCNIEHTDIGDRSSYCIHCPFAESVHPKLPSDQVLCPISFLVAGAARL